MERKRAEAGSTAGRRGRARPLAHGLSERFSEDLDLKVEPGSVTALAAESIDNAWRGASLRAAYLSMYPGELPPEVSDQDELTVIPSASVI